MKKLNKNTFKFPSFILSLVLFLLSFNSFASTADTINNPKKTLPSKNSISPNTIIPSENLFIYKQDSESEFTDEYIKKNYPVSQDVNNNLELAMATFESIAKNGNLTDVLEPKKLLMLPLGISKTIGGIQYVLGISSAKFTPNYTELTAFVKIVLPQIDSQGNQKQLFFGATNIKLSYKGGLVGDTNLVLLGDVPIKMLGENSLVILKGGMDMTTGIINKKTYVTIDCNGFKELGITADIEFSRSILEPLDDNNKVILDVSKKVSGTFSTIVANWNDILVEISLPKFQLSSFKGTSFDLEKAVIDLSDLRNHENVIWPLDYEKDYLIPGNENLWRGVYIKSLKVTLPEQFKLKGSSERISFQGTDMLIDRMGFSGKILGSNILSLSKGEASKWQFSVDGLQLGFKANTLVSGGFFGSIVLPVTKTIVPDTPVLTKEEVKNRFLPAKMAVATSTPKVTETKNPDPAGAPEKSKVVTQALEYFATIDPINNEYILTAKPKDDLEFGLFKGKAKLASNSFVELKVSNGKFLPKAVLTGSLSINGSNVKDENVKPEDENKGTVDFKGIEFEDLQLQTVTPYIKAKYFGYKGEVKLSNFPVSISNIAFESDDTSASLAFTLAVNLMENQFNGQTRLKIVGGFGADQGIQKWKFDYLKLEEIKLEADLGGAKFKGSITIMDNDPVYGKGFKGSLNAKFSGGIEVEANAIFGNKDFRYWYVDAMVDGLNIPAGAITFRGFAGGAFYRMEKEGFSSSFAASGSNYVPDTDSGLGVKALIKFSATATADSFWGGAGFEIAFLRTGGVRRISIYGEGHIMQPFEIPGADALKDALKVVEEVESKIPAAALEVLKSTNLSKAAEDLYPNNVKQSMGLNAFAAIEYDFVLKTLHGTFDLYIDTPGGIIKGRASGNRAGWAVIHIAPNKWYFRAGTPTDRLGLKMGFGSFNIETGGYFMIGDDIPGSPAPPSVIASILKIDNAKLDYMRNENSSKIGSGRGFAFGADFSLSTGNINYLAFYANLQAGIGFDIMMKDYGEAQCKGSGTIGINGWYANGQSYAYIDGELGININLLFVKKKIPILKAGAAVLLQAKLPNPVWLRGYMGGYYDILGGAIKGRFNFKVELGQQCEFVNSTPLAGIHAIGDVAPADAAKEVDVFAVPQVSFNIAVGKSFDFEEDKGKKTYQLNILEYAIKKDGIQIHGKTTWNNSNDLVTFQPDDILPEKSDFTLDVKVSFQEYVNGNWKTVMDNGQPAVEAKSIKFTTGTAPNHIPLNNIAYCYPLIDQKYFYSNESNQAFVVLKQGQPNLFAAKEGFTQKAVFKSSNTSTAAKITYNDKRIGIEIPTLLQGKLYSMVLLNVAPQSAIGSNVSEKFETQNLGDDSSAEIKNNTLTQTATTGEDVEILNYSFNTSNYKTFAEKIKAKTSTQTIVDPIYTDVHALQSANTGSEPFDIVELLGNSYTDNKPMINVEAILDDAYYLNEIYPILYQGYPLKPEITVNRATAVIGTPPTKGIEVMSWYQSYLANDPKSFLLEERLPFRYNLVSYYKEDFNALRFKVSNYYVNSQDASYNVILTRPFPDLKTGTYKMKLTYTLPDGTVKSNATFSYNKKN